MPAVKDVLRHVSTEAAGRKGKCYRKPNDHVITRGDPCLVVRDGPQQQRTDCADCARDILDKAQARVDELLQGVTAK